MAAIHIKRIRDTFGMLLADYPLCGQANGHHAVALRRNESIASEVTCKRCIKRQEQEESYGWDSI